MNTGYSLKSPPSSHTARGQVEGGGVQETVSVFDRRLRVALRHLCRLTGHIIIIIKE